MIYIIHKTLALLKNLLNYLKDKILECFFKKYNIIVFITYNDEKSRLEGENIIKDVRNLFRLKKN